MEQMLVVLAMLAAMAEQVFHHLLPALQLLALAVAAVEFKEEPQELGLTAAETEHQIAQLPALGQ
jgi:hypothetical protein